MNIRRWLGIGVGSAFLLGLAGCSTPQITNTPRGVVEQLLIATAIERGVSQFPLGQYRGRRVLMDYANLSPQVDKPYLIGMLEIHLAANGIILVTDAKEAEYVMQAYCGVLATDDHHILFGTPTLPIPLPNTSSNLAVPELALFKKTKRRAMGRLALNVVRISDRMPVQSISGVNSQSEFINWVILFVPFSSHTLPIQQVEQGESDFTFFD